MHTTIDKMTTMKLRSDRGGYKNNIRRHQHRLNRRGSKAQKAVRQYGSYHDRAATKRLQRSRPDLQQTTRKPAKIRPARHARFETGTPSRKLPTP